MKLTILGTGCASVTECYNTCFVLSDNGQNFMVDGGGGNTIFKQLKSAGINWKSIRHIFITHKHMDHLFGIMWFVRMICQHINRNTYEGEAYIYGHDEVIKIIGEIANLLLLKRELDLIGDKLHLVTVEDGEELDIIGHRVRFFDVRSIKTKQFGFTMYYGDGKKLTCCGDEPFHDCEKEYVYGSEWLLHEAFCLYSQADIFKPYEKNHSTVADACKLAAELKIKNLILYHTEDKNLQNRKTLYYNEGREYFSGNLYIPNDLEVFDIL